MSTVLEESNTTAASVLVVNDFPLQLEVLSLLLRKAGYRVLTASNGVEGFEVAKEEHPDLIISDVVMPHMDGIEMCQHLRAHPELRALPVLLISALRKDSDSVCEGLEAGASDYIEAPYDPNRLTLRVAQLVEQKQTKGALVDSQAQLSMIIESALDAIITIDADEHILLFNRAAEKMFRCSADEAIGQNLDRFIPERFRAAHKKHIKNFCCKDTAGHSMHVGDSIFGLRADGEEFPIEASISLIESDGRRLFTVILRDITERKQAEEELQTSERRFRQLAENINEVFWVFDPNKPEMLYVSPAYEETWGRTCKSLYERPDSFLETVHPDDREKIIESNKRQQSGMRSKDDYRIVRPDGSVRWIQDRAFPIKDETGKVIRIVGIAEDITERKRADEEIRHSLSLINATFEVTADGILAVNCAGKIVAFNKQFVEMWRIPESAIAERDDAKALEAVCDQLKEPEAFKATVKDHYERPELESWDIIEFKDGRLFERCSKPQRVNEEIVGRVWSFRDVTERRRLEDQLQQAQRMEAVGRLAGGIAHDFNNLLTAITGYSELALRKLSQNDPLRVNMEEIGKAAQRAANLTRQLLAFSRKQAMLPKVLDLNSVIREMNKMLPRLIREDIKLELKLADDLARIKADPGQLEQVIVNLVVNAKDAMPQGGQLTIETSNARMDEALVRKYNSVQPGPHVLLRVSDTGYGMDEETQQHIFEPFFTTKEMGKGTGLGLSVVFGIVKQSGGSIWVKSEVGRGTTFSVYLPSVEAQVDVLEAPSTPKQLVRGTETVLLVEDDDLVRRIARTTLDMCGYKVLEAENGGEALLISQELKGNIDLMLTDVVMPRMNGRRLGQEISRLRPEIKVLYMSGHTYEETAPHGILEEGVPFIHKPFTPAALSAKVRELLDSGK